MAKKKTTTPPGPAAKKTPPGPAGKKVITEYDEKLAWEVISNSMAKQANGEVLRWRYNQANGELIVLLVDGRKFHSFFDVQD